MLLQLSQRKRRRLLFIGLMVIFFSMISCSLFFSYSAVDLQPTLVALRVQQTSLALTATALEQPRPAPFLESTPAASPSALPVTSTLEAVDPLTATLTSPGTGENDERILKSAKILLFEDMSASRHIRYVKEALDQENYFYLDVGSARGWFKTQLISPEPWNLIIAAAEARREFGGELIELIDNRVQQGSATIIEYYDFDLAPHGRAKTFLDRCGLEVQSDWYEPNLRVFFWLDRGHPVFHQPYEIPSQLGNDERLWFGDIGDLLRIKTNGGQAVGDAKLLAGANPTWKEDHGVLATCLGGRVIVQTFSSHEYRRRDIVPLWKNYIYQTLRNHFNQTGALLPTPAATMPAISQATPQPTHPETDLASADPFKGTCGDVFDAKLVQAPRYQRDLFEHHAQGEFLILRLEMFNRSEFPVQIWDEDYFIEGELSDGRPITYALHRAATGYLYIDRPANLWQDIIEPGRRWSTNLAFDIDPRGGNWVLVVRPGSEFNQTVCELRLSLTQ